MFLNRRTTAWLAACASLCGVLVLSSFAAAQKKGGGGPQPPSLPADLKVRYRVEFLPLPTNASYYAVHAVNDFREAVGGYDEGPYDVWPRVRVGFYYNADTNTLLTARQMIPSLPPAWVSTSFAGINNDGVIVGKVEDSSGFSQCLLIFPPIASAIEHTYVITAPVDALGPMDSRFSRINDSGDIVGISWDDFGVGLAFAYNPGLFSPALARDFTVFGFKNARWSEPLVTNARLGAVRAGDKLSLFDFVDGKEYLPTLPPNERMQQGHDGLSNDGQITISEAVWQQKGSNGSYRYKPGIMTPKIIPGSKTVSMNYVWQGNLDDGYATLVNSAVGSNKVGDVVGVNTISSVYWLRHADRPDWGYLNLNAMVVFDSVADAERWSRISGRGARVNSMSDRDTTGFGVLIGFYSVANTNAAYVLIPEIVP